MIGKYLRRKRKIKVVGIRVWKVGMIIGELLISEIVICWFILSMLHEQLSAMLIHDQVISQESVISQYFSFIKISAYKTTKHSFSKPHRPYRPKPRHPSPLDSPPRSLTSTHIQLTKKIKTYINFPCKHKENFTTIVPKQ